MIAPTNAEALPILPEPEVLELKKHLKQVSEHFSTCDEEFELIYLIVEVPNMTIFNIYKRMSEM